MSSRSSLVLASIVLGCACGAWCLYSRWNGPVANSAVERPALEPSTTTPARAESAPHTAKLESIPQESAAREASPPPDPRAAALEVYQARRTGFEKKYAGKSRLELEVALGSLAPIESDMLERLIELRRKAGLAARVDGVDGQPTGLRERGLTDAERAVPNPSGAFAGSVHGGGSDSSAEVVSIPHGAYPEFDALQAETGWLREQIRKFR